MKRKLAGTATIVPPVPGDGPEPTAHRVPAGTRRSRERRTVSSGEQGKPPPRRRRRLPVGRRGMNPVRRKTGTVAGVQGTEVPGTKARGTWTGVPGPHLMKGGRGMTATVGGGTTPPRARSGAALTNPPPSRGRPSPGRPAQGDRAVPGTGRLEGGAERRNALAGSAPGVGEETNLLTDPGNDRVPETMREVAGVATTVLPVPGGGGPRRMRVPGGTGKVPRPHPGFAGTGGTPPARRARGGRRRRRRRTRGGSRRRRNRA